MPDNICHINPKTTDVERNSIIRTIMNMAPPFAIGTSKVCNVEVDVLSMDMDYQRDSQQKSKRLRQEFDYNKLDPITLSYRDGLLFVIDGGHRIDAAIYNGIHILPACIHEGMTKEEEAERFAEQDRNEVGLRPYDKFKAHLVYSEPIDTAIKTVCDKYGLTVSEKGKGVDRPMTAIDGCRSIMKSVLFDGAACLDWMFGIMDKVNWLENKAAITKIVDAFRSAYTEAIREDRVEEYTANLIEGLSHINVKHFTGYASVKFPQFDHRMSAKAAMQAIARGDITFDDIKAIADN